MSQSSGILILVIIGFLIIVASYLGVRLWLGWFRSDKILPAFEWIQLGKKNSLIYTSLLWAFIFFLFW